MLKAQFDRSKVEENETQFADSALKSGKISMANLSLN